MCFGWCRRSDPADKAFDKGNKCYEDYKKSQRMEDLTKAIGQYKDCLELRLETKKNLAGQEPPEFTKKMADIYLYYSVAVLDKYLKQPTSDDLKLLTRLGLKLLEVAVEPYSNTYASALYNFGNTFFRSYYQELRSFGNPSGSGIDARQLFSQALEMNGKLLQLKDGKGGMDSKMRQMALMDQGKMLLQSYDYSRDEKRPNIETLNQAVVCLDEARTLSVPDLKHDQARLRLRDCLGTLAAACYRRYESTEVEEDLQRSIDHYKASREKYTLEEKNSRGWIMCSHNLATVLYKSYGTRQGINNKAKYLTVDKLNPDRGGVESLREAQAVEMEVMSVFEYIGGGKTAEWRLSETKGEVETLLQTIDDHSTAISRHSKSRTPSPASSRNSLRA